MARRWLQNVKSKPYETRLVTTVVAIVTNLRELSSNAADSSDYECS